MGATPLTDTEQDPKVERIQLLMARANEARREFQMAGQRFAELSQQEAELLTELMETAYRMHGAKVKVDVILAEIRATAGLV